MKRYWNSLARATFKKVKLHDAQNPAQYIGRKVLAGKLVDQIETLIDGRKLPLITPILSEPEEITITSIIGSRPFEKYFELNGGTHHCHMYSFFVQLMEDRCPTKEEMDDFELASQVKNIRSLDGTPKKN
jgi:hypothetical protein